MAQRQELSTRRPDRSTREKGLAVVPEGEGRSAPPKLPLSAPKLEAITVRVPPPKPGGTSTSQFLREISPATAGTEFSRQISVATGGTDFSRQVSVASAGSQLPRQVSIASAGFHLTRHRLATKKAVCQLPSQRAKDYAAENAAGKCPATLRVAASKGVGQIAGVSLAELIQSGMVDRARAECLTRTVPQSEWAAQEAGLGAKETAEGPGDRQSPKRASKTDESTDESVLSIWELCELASRADVRLSSGFEASHHDARRLMIKRLGTLSELKTTDPVDVLLAAEDGEPALCANLQESPESRGHKPPQLITGFWHEGLDGGPGSAQNPQVQWQTHRTTLLRAELRATLPQEGHALELWAIRGTQWGVRSSRLVQVICSAQSLAEAPGPLRVRIECELPAGEVVSLVLARGSKPTRGSKLAGGDRKEPARNESYSDDEDIQSFRTPPERPQDDLQEFEGGDGEQREDGEEGQGAARPLRQRSKSRRQRASFPSIGQGDREHRAVPAAPVPWERPLVPVQTRPDSTRLWGWETASEERPTRSPGGGSAARARSCGFELRLWLSTTPVQGPVLLGDCQGHDEDSRQGEGNLQELAGKTISPGTLQNLVESALWDVSATIAWRTRVDMNSEIARFRQQAKAQLLPAAPQAAPRTSRRTRPSSGGRTGVAPARPRSAGGRRSHR
ncbi:unnamed protein product [Polarella glacialis]|uniref:Uncharacterized protein n=1 Tax=Polarella glacialis TaxID=89957 RepID=A0A813KQM6_POLGL|nr:unnamed protein product [Polarella glacialis]